MEFNANTRVCVKTAPDKIGRITGKKRQRAGRIRYEVDFGNKLEYILSSNLEAVEEQPDIYELIEKGHYGAAVNLRSIITHTRLTGRLADVVYSMEASNTEFFPYQFKPVLNFLDSPSQGILIADEVGLGKTIEAGLIWTELRARFDANRLLVICPAVLREKWQEELAHRFGVWSEICNAGELTSLLERQVKGAVDGFAAILSLQGGRPPKRWEEHSENTSGSARLARFLSNVDPGQPIFDCVIIDEAHYLRNPQTQTHELGQLVRAAAEHMVLLSATPIQIRSDDLFHLLNIIDSENFQFIDAFREVLEANRPLVKLASELRRNELNREEWLSALSTALSHPLLRDNRQLGYFLENPPDEEKLKRPADREALATRVERVNLLARVVNRTRKRDVTENTVVREVNAPTVEMTGLEEEFYHQVNNQVRKYCWDRELSEGFILTIPQRQMCSSMPAAFRAWQKKLDDCLDEALLYESGVDDDYKGKLSIGPLVATLSRAVGEFATFEALKAGDSKYKALIEQLRSYWKRYPEKKVILFSYYRETLHYLQERMQEEEINAMLLLGGMKESKHSMIDAFRKSSDHRILLASEVASEGVDLQFSSFVINYDLPWNPMRVEQRIGRIDRIGQKEDRILISNFFYADTLDDRIYNRLFNRLDIFRHALGDIEAVLGEKIKEMTFYLLSHDLTEKQELERIEQTELAVARTKREQEELEEEAVHLAAHGDYVLNRVKAAREMRRYIKGQDLWVYVRDVLKTQYPGCDLIRVSDDPLVVDMELSQQAKTDLQQFLERSKSLGTTRLARSLGGDAVRCVFSNQVDFASHQHEVVNQHHPFVRFIIDRMQGKDFHPLVATSVAHIDVSVAIPGTYLLTIQMWRTTGARTVEKLIIRGLWLNDGSKLSERDAELLLNTAVDRGADWPEAKAYLQQFDIVDGYGELLDILDDEFQEYAELMTLENSDRVNFLIRTLEDKVNRQIGNLQNRIDRLRHEGKTRIIPALEGQVRKQEENLKLRKSLYEKQRTINTEQTDITTVVIHVQ